MRNSRNIPGSSAVEPRAIGCSAPHNTITAFFRRREIAGD
jgi:hypothetical protein